MEKNILIIFLVLINGIVLGQDSELNIHLKSIDSTFYPGHEIDKDSIFNANMYFVDLIKKRKLTNSSDLKFISDRRLLSKLENKICNIDNYDVKIFDKLKTNEKVEIYIKVGKFNPKSHNITYMDSTKYFVKSIDGQEPLGTAGSMPLKEISELKILIDNKEIKIPKSAFSNIFYPRLCEEKESFHKNVEVYNSISGKYLYIYFYGGQSASTYFGKLVFDKEKYLTKIFAGYYELGTSSSFRENFIGF